MGQQVRQTAAPRARKAVQVRMLPLTGRRAQRHTPGQAQGPQVRIRLRLWLWLWLRTRAELWPQLHLQLRLQRRLRLPGPQDPAAEGRRRQSPPAR